VRREQCPLLDISGHTDKSAPWPLYPPGDLVSFSSPTQLSLNGAMAVSQEIGQSDTWQRYVTGGSIDPVLVPEPSALALFASGLGLLGWLAWYWRRKAPALFGASAGLYS